MTELQDQGVVKLQTYEEIVQAFRTRQLRYEAEVSDMEDDYQWRNFPFGAEPLHRAQDVLRSLGKTKDTQPRLGGISYRVLKIITDTDVGKAIINDINCTVPDPDRRSYPRR